MFTPFAFRSIKAEVTPSAFSAIGGQTYTFISSSISYKVHYFTSSGNFEVLSGSENIDYMIVGGGGGSAEFSGGGGAGGVLTGSLLVTPQTYSFVVGDGGPAVLTTAIGNPGTGSSAFGLTAIGGGAGAGSSGALQGGTGGSGGGGSPRNGAAGLGTSPQGQNGGSGRPGYTSGNDGGSGGGGGFSEVGANGGFRAGGDGGDGIDMSLVFGTTIGDDGWFAGGGGGMGDSRNGTSTAGQGGLGGGGLGGKVAFTVDNTEGQANTGGGAGGGAPGGDGKKGGSGIVVLRYLFGSIDTDAEAFLTAAGITDPTIESAINTLVIDLKDEGLWTKLIALYPFVGGTATTHKWNLKDPRDLDAAFRLTFNGTITHDTNGVTGDGSTGWYNTYCSILNDLSQNSAAIFAYIRNNTQSNVEMGAFNVNGPQTGLQFSSRNASNQLSNRVMAGVDTTVSNTNSIGLNGVSRTNSSNYIVKRNKTTNTITKASAAVIDLNLAGLANRSTTTTVTSFSNHNQGLAGISSGLTSDEFDDLVDINETFQTTLGRFV
jgi:hypothetical protein